MPKKSFKSKQCAFWLCLSCLSLVKCIPALAINKMESFIIFQGWNASKLIQSGILIDQNLICWFLHSDENNGNLESTLYSSCRKLHGIQNELMDQPSVFYIPNLERCNQQANNIIGTSEFLSHQCDLNVVWHIIEGQPSVFRNINVELKNMKHFIEMSAIDFNSSIQLTFDVITQLLEVCAHFTLKFRLTSCDFFFGSTLNRFRFFYPLID